MNKSDKYIFRNIFFLCSKEERKSYRFEGHSSFLDELLQEHLFTYLGTFCCEYLEGLFVIQHVAGMVHGEDGEVEESAGRADMQVKREEPALDEAKRVSV